MAGSSSLVAGSGLQLAGRGTFLAGRGPAESIHGRQATGAILSKCLVRWSRKILEYGQPCKQSLSKAKRWLFGVRTERMHLLLPEAEQ